MGRFGYGLTCTRPGVIASDEYVYRGGRFSHRGAPSEEHARMVSIMCRAAIMGTNMEGAMLDALGPGSGPASLARLGGARARSSTLGLLAHKCSANMSIGAGQRKRRPRGRVCCSGRWRAGFMSMIERLPALTGSMWSAISVTMAVSWRATAR